MNPFKSLTERGFLRKKTFAITASQELIRCFVTGARTLGHQDQGSVIITFVG
jgi:hypothetical protein